MIQTNAEPIWITGAGGLIGSWLVRTAGQAAHSVLGLTRAQLDLTDFPAVRRFCNQHAPQLVIHCAALSRSPECEADPVSARRLNVDATAFLAELAANIPFVFFSSDLVFDGCAGNYDEASAVNPLSVYAETKVAAEKIVLSNPRHTVIRTSLNCGASPTGDRGFDEQMCRAWKQGRTLRLFTDEFRCPIPAETTARAVWELATQGQAGLFHVAGAERLSRWRIGEIIAACWPELEPRIQSASLSEYSGAPRPPDTSLNCAKAQHLLSFALPKFSDWAQRRP